MRTSEPFPSPPINFGRGPVSLTAPSLSASNLTIDTRGPGDNISIRATGDVTLKNSSISTGSPELMGIDAGNITVQAAKLDLTESTIDSNAEGGGHIGNIAIDVGRLTMQGGRIRTSGFEHSAPGGNISVSARGLFSLMAAVSAPETQDLKTAVRSRSSLPISHSIMSDAFRRGATAHGPAISR